jgi:hypothetical protein
MGNIAIGIGGAGAKCIEALVHLCAAGLGPEGDLWILLIDPDRANGNVARATQLISQYITCRKNLALEKEPDVPIFRTEIKYPGTGPQDMSWSPVGDAICLSSYFGYPLLDRNVQDMCRLLYSREELDLEWDQGFRGRASIGAPVMATMKEVLEEKPWYDIVNFAQTQLSGGVPVGIFICGSIFGATGASGFPTVATIFKEHAESKNWQNRKLLKFGGALLLPYFSFNIPPQQEEICAHPESFLENTRAALDYYKKRWKTHSSYHSAYFLGDDKQDKKGSKEFALGGERQCNWAHFIELYSAIAAEHFYRKVKKEVKEEKGKDAAPEEITQYYVGREKEDIISWGDVPWDTLQKDILVFTSFAFASLSFYFQLIRQEEKFEKKRNLSPWYVDHFKPYELTRAEVKNQVESLEDYLQSYLEWLYQIHVSTDRKLELINEAALESSRNQEFLRLDDNQMRTLLFRAKESDKWSYDPKHKSGYDKVWEKICKIKPAQIDSPLGRLSRLIYKASEQFCISNYKLEK